MKSFMANASVLVLCAFSVTSADARCRNIPGSAGYPTTAAWNAFNSSISGHLVKAVPSAKYCASLPAGACTDAQWNSALFRSKIPGAMNQVNWEQGYDLSPPSLCLRNATTCGQGDVPTYAVEATSAADIQAAVKFAATWDLRLAVKASGHDYLGRSTAPNSLLISTAKLTDISVSDAFMVGGQSLGPAITVGSGVHSQDLYQQAKARGKIAVGGSAATVCASGGYLQGAGHSALSPTYGLAADNAFEFKIVVASGELLTANSVSNPDLFWALRGGGAGSWGVLVSASFRTFPTFNITFALITLSASSPAALGTLATLHAQHIFDLDPIRGSQYFYVTRPPPTEASQPQPITLTLYTYMPNSTTTQAAAIFAPFLNAAKALSGVTLVSETYTYALINDVLFQADDSVGSNVVLGSRLIPTATYANSPQLAGKVYQQLLDAGSLSILGHLVAGGQVTANAGISNAVNPAWRTAKTHIVLVNEWTDSTPLAQIKALRTRFRDVQLPILKQLSGANAGAYSNEADVLEATFQTTFFGPNYAKLSAIKATYDPKDLFIVGAGVGSERWDQWGICTV
ncbi:FAD-binding domain-containing protein [Mycena rebaudengoi]|nr:FAD-binding domain-containing protein [Mycena rebaudengoi]